MNGIKKLTLAVVMALLMTQIGSIASAATVAELQTQLAQLTSQLSGMQTQAVAYAFTRNLTVGSKGADVQKLQQFLISAGYLKNATATTYFGTQTRAALAAWQKAKGISPAVGYFGPTTRARVNALSTSTVTTPGVSYVFTRNLTVGSTGADVKKLQEFLMSTGYLNIPTATTYFGAQTKAALMAWQRANGMPTGTGGFEAVTRGKVNAALAMVASVTPSVSYISRPVAVVVGSSVAVKFTSTGYRQANIYLCKTQTDCNTVIGANVAVVAGENTFTWAVPADVVSGSYTIKVEDVANSNWVVYTDVPLTQPVVTATTTATTPPTQPLIAAIALELPTLAHVGNPLAIKYTSRNVKNVSIVLCTDSEHCDISVTSKYATVDGQNSYIWTVPTSITATRQYFLKIKDADDINAREFKSDLFTITALPVVPVVPVATSTINITTPGAAKVGDLLAIKFTPRKINTVSISLCSDTLHCDITVTSRYTVRDAVANSYYWNIPTTTAPMQYFVKMRDADAASSTEYVSDLFTIGSAVDSGPTIVLAQPAATNVGKSLALSYTTKGVSAVDIYFCASQTRCDVSIVRNASTTDDIHTYAWTIPAATVPGEYYVKITQASSTTPFAVSKTSFAVGAAPGTVCRDVEGPIDITTTCDNSEEAISGRCYLSKLPSISVSAPDVTIWPGGMGAVCAPVAGTIWVKVRCCK